MISYLKSSRLVVLIVVVACFPARAQEDPPVPEFVPEGFICNVWEHLPQQTFTGCFGDVDGNGFVNAGDRGFIAVNIGAHDPVKMCLYDLDGNGFVNAADRGFVAANIGRCEPLPDFQSGTGKMHGAPDLRFGGPVGDAVDMRLAAIGLLLRGHVDDAIDASADADMAGLPHSLSVIVDQVADADGNGTAPGPGGDAEEPSVTGRPNGFNARRTVLLYAADSDPDPGVDNSFLYLGMDVSDRDDIDADTNPPRQFDSDNNGLATGSSVPAIVDNNAEFYQIVLRTCASDAALSGFNPAVANPDNVFGNPNYTAILQMNALIGTPTILLSGPAGVLPNPDVIGPTVRVYPPRGLNHDADDSNIDLFLGGQLLTCPGATTCQPPPGGACTCNDTEFLLKRVDTHIGRFAMARLIARFDAGSAGEGFDEERATNLARTDIPEVSIEKSVRCEGESDALWRSAIDATPNSVIEFDVTLENTGNTDLDITLTDVMANLPGVCAQAGLAPITKAIVEQSPGGNGIVDTAAAGDDIQVAAVGAAVSPGDVIILPGPNGVINSAPAAGEAQVTTTMTVRLFNGGVGAGTLVNFGNAVANGLRATFFGPQNDQFLLNTITGVPTVLGIIDGVDACNPEPMDGDRVVIRFKGYVSATAAFCTTCRGTAADARNSISVVGDMDIPSVPDADDVTGSSSVNVNIICRDVSVQVQVSVPGGTPANMLDLETLNGGTGPVYPQDLVYTYKVTNNGEVAEDVSILERHLCADVTAANTAVPGSVTFVACNICTSPPGSSFNFAALAPATMGTQTCRFRFANEQALRSFLTRDDARDPAPDGFPAVCGDPDPEMYRNCVSASSRPTTSTTCFNFIHGDAHADITFHRVCMLNVNKRARCVETGTPGPLADPLSATPDARTEFVIEIQNTGMDAIPLVCITDSMSCGTWFVPGTVVADVAGAPVTLAGFAPDGVRRCFTLVRSLNQGETLTIRYQTEVPANFNTPGTTVDCTNTVAVDGYNSTTADTGQPPEATCADTDDSKINAVIQNLTFDKLVGVPGGTPAASLDLHTLNAGAGPIFPQDILYTYRIVNNSEVAETVTITERHLCTDIAAANTADPGSIVVVDCPICTGAPAGEVVLPNIAPGATATSTCRIRFRDEGALNAFLARDDTRDPAPDSFPTVCGDPSSMTYRNCARAVARPSDGAVCHVTKTFDDFASITFDRSCTLDVNKRVRCVEGGVTGPLVDLLQSTPDSRDEYVVEVTNTGVDPIPLVCISDTLTCNTWLVAGTTAADVNGTAVAVAGFAPDGVRRCFTLSTPINPGQKLTLRFQVEVPVGFNTPGTAIDCTNTATVDGYTSTTANTSLPPDQGCTETNAAQINAVTQELTFQKLVSAPGGTPAASLDLHTLNGGAGPTFPQDIVYTYSATNGGEVAADITIAERHLCADITAANTAVPGSITIVDCPVCPGPQTLTNVAAGATATATCRIRFNNEAALNSFLARDDARDPAPDSFPTVCGDPNSTSYRNCASATIRPTSTSICYATKTRESFSTITFSRSCTLDVNKRVRCVEGGVTGPLVDTLQSTPDSRDEYVVEVTNTGSDPIPLVCISDTLTCSTWLVAGTTAADVNGTAVTLAGFAPDGVRRCFTLSTPINPGQKLTVRFQVEVPANFNTPGTATDCTNTATVDGYTSTTANTSLPPDQGCTETDAAQINAVTQELTFQKLVSAPGGTPAASLDLHTLNAGAGPTFPQDIIYTYSATNGGEVASDITIVERHLCADIVAANTAVPGSITIVDCLICSGPTPGQQTLTNVAAGATATATCRIRFNTEAALNSFLARDDARDPAPDSFPTVCGNPSAVSYRNCASATIRPTSTSICYTTKTRDSFSTITFDRSCTLTVNARARCVEGGTPGSLVNSLTAVPDSRAEYHTEIMNTGADPIPLICISNTLTCNTWLVPGTVVADVNGTAVTLAGYAPDGVRRCFTLTTPINPGQKLTIRYQVEVPVGFNTPGTAIDCTHSVTAHGYTETNANTGLPPDAGCSATDDATINAVVQNLAFDKLVSAPGGTPAAELDLTTINGGSGPIFPQEILYTYRVTNNSEVAEAATVTERNLCTDITAANAAVPGSIVIVDCPICPSGQVSFASIAPAAMATSTCRIRFNNEQALRSFLMRDDARDPAPDSFPADCGDPRPTSYRNCATASATAQSTSTCRVGKTLDDYATITFARSICMLRVDKDVRCAEGAPGSFIDPVQATPGSKLEFVIRITNTGPDSIGLLCITDVLDCDAWFLPGTVTAGIGATPVALPGFAPDGVRRCFPLAPPLGAGQILTIRFQVQVPEDYSDATVYIDCTNEVDVDGYSSSTANAQLPPDETCTDGDDASIDVLVRAVTFSKTVGLPGGAQLSVLDLGAINAGAGPTFPQDVTYEYRVANDGEATEQVTVTERYMCDDVFDADAADPGSVAFVDCDICLVSPSRSVVIAGVTPGGEATEVCTIRFRDRSALSAFMAADDGRDPAPDSFPEDCGDPSVFRYRNCASAAIDSSDGAICDKGDDDDSHATIVFERACECCDMNCPPQGTTRYSLHNHPAAGGQPPPYGLRLDELRNVTAGNDSFTFDFDHPMSAMFLDLSAMEIRIFGQAFGGLDTGASHGDPDHAGIWIIEYLFDTGVKPAPGDDDVIVDTANFANEGRIRATFGPNQDWIPLTDYRGPFAFSFRFGNDQNDLGYLGYFGISGWGWVNHNGLPHIPPSDWLFTALLDETCINGAHCEDDPTKDTIPPQIECPDNVDVACAGGSTDPEDTGFAEAGDECDEDVEIMYADGEPSNNCPATFVRTWKATDECGNFDTCMQLIRITDEHPPTITCPPDVLCDCTGPQCPPCVIGEPIVDDDCDDDVEVTFEDDTSPDCATVFTRTWTATDDCGNPASCTQEVVLDNCDDCECCDRNCPPAGGNRYRLHNHPDGGGQPPGYGMVLTELFNVTGGTDSFTFNFDDPQSAMWMDVTPTTIHIFGRSYGGLDTGTTYGNATWRGVWEIDVLYNVGVGTATSDDDKWVNTANFSNFGTVRATFGANQNPVGLRDFRGSSNYSFRFGNEDNDLGHRNFVGLSGWGWFNYVDRSHVPPSDWLFTAELRNDCIDTEVCDAETHDLVPPQITCPAAYVCPCTGAGCQCNPGQPTVHDTCDDSPEVTYQDTPSANCPTMFTRTWTATDECGNSASCTQSVTLDDCTACECCDRNCPPAGGNRYRLHNHPDGSGQPPGYGLVLTELFNPTGGTDSFTFNFDDALSAMWMDVTPTTIHVFGKSYGGLDTGTTYGNATWRGVWEIDVLYSVGVMPAPGDDDVLVNAANFSNQGTIRATFGSNQSPVTLQDYRGASSYSFRFGNEDNDLGHRNFAGLSGWGWFNYVGRSHVPPSDWLFTAELRNDCIDEEVCNAEDHDIVPPTITCPPTYVCPCNDTGCTCNPGQPTVDDDCDEHPAVTYADTPSAECATVFTRRWTARDACGNTASCNQSVTIAVCPDCEPDVECDAHPTDPPGDEGCTRKYWKDHTGSWPSPYATGTDFDTIFGVSLFNPNKTLLQALQLGTSGNDYLAREAVAALLNAAAADIDYPLTTAQVIARLQGALAAGGNPTETRDLFLALNDLGCPREGEDGALDDLEGIDVLKMSWDVGEDCDSATVAAVLDIGCETIPLTEDQVIFLECISHDYDGACVSEYYFGYLYVRTTTAILRVTVTTSDGDAECEQVLCDMHNNTEGCSPGFWKNHEEDWTAPYDPTDDFDATFGVAAFNPNLTLDQAIHQGGGGVNALGRHAVAALLNAASPAVNFPLSVMEVKSLVQAALAAGGDIEEAKDQLEELNNLDCPLGEDDYSDHTVLFVVPDPAALDTDDQMRLSLFESWGYPVMLIDESDTQAAFDADVAQSQVAYVTENCSSSNIAMKLTDAPIGVLNDEAAMHDNLGTSTADGTSYTGTQIDVMDNTHYITEGFNMGGLTIVSASQELAVFSGTLAAGAAGLGEKMSSSSKVLVALDTGDLQADGLPAAGRRVMLPWAGPSFQPSTLNTNGKTLLRRSLEWAADPAAVALPGLTASWYTGLGTISGLSSVNWAAAPSSQSVVSQVNWVQTASAFYTGGPTNNFAVQIAGWVDVPTAGSWTFYTNSDDGSDLTIDGAAVVANDGSHSMTERSGSVTLTAGRHAIRIRFFENTGDQGLVASWAGPGVAKQVIPAGALNHPGAQ